MKILYITPYSPYIVTPEVGFAHDLARLGHDVTLVQSTNTIPRDILNNKYDIVFGAMEYSMKLANAIGDILKIPVYNHMEWVPPWRVGEEPIEKWGYEKSTIDMITPEQIEQFKKIYKDQVDDWMKATVRSCAGYCLIPGIQKLANEKVECEVKYYAPNIEKLEKYRDSSIKTKYQIMSTARLVPHKKVVHIIRALSLISPAIRPKYVIVGYGTEKEQILKEAERLGVDVEIVGSGDNGIKEKIVQESIFSVNIWAGIPIAESFYFKKPAISYKDEHMYEVFGDSVLYAQPNNIEDLALKIQYFLSRPDEVKSWGERGYQLMMNDKIGMGTPLKLAKQVESILYKGIELYKTKHLNT